MREDINSLLLLSLFGKGTLKVHLFKSIVNAQRNGKAFRINVNLTFLSEFGDPRKMRTIFLIRLLLWKQ